MSSKGQSYDPKNASEQLIEQAQERCHRARREFLQSRYIDRSVEQQTVMGFQFAVMDYYEELRPLRDENIVSGWWDSVELFKQQVGVQLVDADGQELRVADQDERGRVLQVTYPDSDEYYAPGAVGTTRQPILEPVTGLETLQTLFNQTSIKQERVSNTFGKTEVGKEVFEPLDGDRLLSISRVLDDAAKKLGFDADVDTKRPLYDAGKLDTEDYDEPVKDTIPKPQ